MFKFTFVFFVCFIRLPEANNPQWVHRSREGKIGHRWKTKLYAGHGLRCPKTLLSGQTRERRICTPEYLRSFSNIVPKMMSQAIQSCEPPVELKASGIPSTANCVSKFAGCVAQINARPQSGASPEDNLKKALALYATTEKTSFTMMNCFRILESAPKWQQYHIAKVNTVTVNFRNRNNYLFLISIGPCNETSNRTYLRRRKWRFCWNGRTVFKNCPAERPRRLQE